MVSRMSGTHPSARTSAGVAGTLTGIAQNGMGQFNIEFHVQCNIIILQNSGVFAVH